MTPGTAQVVGIVASFLLSAFIVFDSWRQTGKEKLVSASIQAVLFLIVALFISIVFLTPARLPDPIALDIRGWGIAAIAGMVACFFIQRWLGREIGLSSE